MRTIYIFILVQVLVWATLPAQEVRNDSIWVQDILSRGGDYQLTPETLEAIRNGTLLNTEPSVLRPVPAPSTLPLSKDFDELIISDNRFERLHLYPLSPTEMLLYQYEPDSILIIHSALFQNLDSILVREYFRIPHSSIEISAPGDDLFPQNIEFVNGEWQGTIHPRTYATFSLEEGLEDIFEPTERHKRENRKNANAWKTYNMQEMDD